MVKDRKSSTGKHHCPGARKGNCRRNNKLGFCTAHQILCRDHRQIHLKSEDCVDCVVSCLSVATPDYHRSHFADRFVTERER